MEDNNGFIYYEDPDVYDGWMLMYRPSDGKVIWRDYVVRLRNISVEFKRETEEYIRKNLIK